MTHRGPFEPLPFCDSVNWKILTPLQAHKLPFETKATNLQEKYRLETTVLSLIRYLSFKLCDTKWNWYLWMRGGISRGQRCSRIS